MPEEFTLTPVSTPTEDEFTLTPVEKKRVSNPIRQGVAGFTDIATGIPAILGLAGSGIEAGIETLTGDKGFKENFGKAMESGVDSTLLKAGESGRDFVNEAMSIEEPTSTEDQAARLLGGFFPIPGFGAVAGAGKLAKSAKTAFNLLTPAVKTGKGFGLRAGAQLGIGTGVDQGLRAIMDDPKRPLIFSEQALSGEPLPEFSLTPTNTPTINISPDVLDGNADGADELRELDRRVQREKDNSDLKFWATMAGVAVLGAAGAKWARSGSTVSAKQQSIDFGNKVFEKFVDKSQAIDDSLKDIGVDEATRNKVVSNSHTDPLDIAVNFTVTGKLGQGFKLKPGQVAYSVNALEANYTALGKNAKLFDDAMLAQTTRASQIHGAGELFPSARSAKELDEAILAGRAIPEVKELMDKMASTFDVLLDYQVHRGVITKKIADNMRAKATLQDVPDGRLAYMPLYSKDPTTFMQRLAKNYLGINSKEGRKASVIAEYGARSVNVGEDLLRPITALRKYAVSTIAHANEQSFKGHVLDRLARIQRVGDSVLKEADAVGNDLLTARSTRYIGKGTNLDDIDNIPIEIFGGDRTLANRFKAGSINDLRAKFGDEIVTAHMGGELRVYHVPDKGLRAALELNPQLSNGLHALSSWKNLFTQGTTGKYSLFAPISSTFSAQQIAINTAAREGLLRGGKSVGDSIKGVGKLMAANGSGDIARFLAQRIAVHTSLGKTAPEIMVRMQKVLERKFLDATINQVRQETGRTVTGIGNIGNGTIEEVLDAVGKDSARYFGKDQMGLVSELWSTWNTAWHEGPAYGAMLRHIGDVINEGGTLTPQVLRDAVDVSKTLAGDMRRVGTSGFAKGFATSVPFSSAMVQSWNSIGSAAKADFGKFIVGASALIGAPTLSELAYNAAISAGSKPWQDPNAPDKQWTYNDYYWNGYTTQQRTDNFIYFVPGKPPWEAILVPVSPEWGLFRATVIEGADAVFGLSNVGDIGMVDQDKTNRSMFLGAMMRVLDIPIPPPLAAAASGLGMDVRLGLASEVKDDPDNPGRTTSLLRTIPIGQGERITRRSGKTRYVQGDLDRITTAMIQDIFGAAGAAYINVHEAFLSGTRGQEGSIGKGIGLGVDALGKSLEQQARYTQPLFGKALHPNSSDEIAQSLFASRANLTRLDSQLRNGFLGGGVAFADGQPIIGNSFRLSDDPVNLELAAMAQDINSNIGQLDKQIFSLKRDLALMGNSTNLGTIAERQSKMDSKMLEIQAIKARQLATVHVFEAKVSTYLSERYDRDIEIDLTSFKPRPNVSEGSTLQELLK